LVLDKGELAEFDTPSELLKNKDGIFRAMCEKSADWADLKKMAGIED
jgi:ABC-type multidrug transport system fused ATPase/permease subunit